MVGIRIIRFYEEKVGNTVHWDWIFCWIFLDHEIARVKRLDGLGVFVKRRIHVEAVVGGGPAPCGWSVAENKKAPGMFTKQKHEKLNHSFAMYSSFT